MAGAGLRPFPVVGEAVGAGAGLPEGRPRSAPGRCSREWAGPAVDPSARAGEAASLVAPPRWAGGGAGAAGWADLLCALGTAPPGVLGVLQRLPCLKCP